MVHQFRGTTALLSSVNVSQAQSSSNRSCAGVSSSTFISSCRAMFSLIIRLWSPAARRLLMSISRSYHCIVDASFLTREGLYVATTGLISIDGNQFIILIGLQACWKTRGMLAKRPITTGMNIRLHVHRFGHRTPLQCKTSVVFRR